MSGGSYNYLYSKLDLDPYSVDVQEMQSMADRLAGLGYHDLAVEINDFRLDILAVRARWEARARRVYDVLHAVEWLDSHDSGPDAVERAVVAYRTA